MPTARLKQLKSELALTLLPLYEQREAESIITIVLEDVLGVSRLEVGMNTVFDLSAEKESELKSILQRLQTGEPVQYILGQVVFNDLIFKVNPAVLIPRPETEEWLWQIVKAYPQVTKESPLKILDIGTGSGCIAVFLAHHFPKAEVCATDVSEKALQTARTNATINHVSVHFVQHDILTSSKGDFSDFDLIVSNPPYIPHEDKDALHPNVVDFEPHTALFADDEKGLIFYEKITELAVSSLKKGGRLYFEVHAPNAEAVKSIMEHNAFLDVRIFNDLSGRARMVWGILP